MASIKKDLIKINLPEGVTKVGEINILGNRAELTIKSDIPETYQITATYDGGKQFDATLNVVEATVFQQLGLDPSGSIRLEEVLTITATFNKPPVLEDLTFDVPEGWEIAEEAKVSGNTIVVKYTIGGDVGPGKVVTANFRDGKDEKTATIEVKDTLATLTGLTSDAQKARIGVPFVVRAKFNKPVEELSHVSFVLPDGVTTSVEPAISGSEVTTTLVGNKEGIKEIRVNYFSAHQTTNVEILKDAIITATEVVDEAEAQVGKPIQINVTYDKEPVEGQPAFTVELPEHMTETVPYAENEDRRGGKVTVTAEQAQEYTVTFVSGEYRKDVTFTVGPKVEISSMEVSPDTVEAGENTKVVLEFIK